MKSSYLNKYTIVQIFKSNDFQKIYIATDNKNNQAVVINTIFIEPLNSIWSFVEQYYKDIFDHVLHFEKADHQIVFVTKVEEGLSLDVYLRDFSPSFTERVNLIHQYLNNIKRYDILPSNIKSILSDESQIIINKGKLFFDELVIFNENSFVSHDFEEVRNNIISVIKKLTNMKSINYEELPLYAQVIGFLDELKKNNKPYNSINDIFNDFEKLNINNLFITNSQKNMLDTEQGHINYDPNDLIGRKVGSIDENAIRVARTNKKHTLTLAIGTVGIAALALTGLFVFKSTFQANTDTSIDAAIDSSKIIASQNLDEDPYTQSVVTENVSAEAIGPNANINYISESIEQDFTTSKYGDYSFKISQDNNNSHKLSINQGPIEVNSQLLMWLKLDSDDEIKINIEGFSKEILSFQKSISHKPLYLNTWELIQYTFDKNIDDYVDISFDGIDGTVWIDKISIDIYK